MKKTDYRKYLASFFKPTYAKMAVFIIILILEAIPYFYFGSFWNENFLGFVSLMLLIGPPGAMAGGIVTILGLTQAIPIFQIFTVIYAYIVACIAVFIYSDIVKSRK